MIDFTCRIGKLRALIGDTNEDALEFPDEQLEVYLELSCCNLVLAGIMALQALVSKYASTAGDEYRVDTIQYREGKSKASFYQSLLDNLKKSLEDGTNPLLVGLPRTYGIYWDDRIENRRRMDNGEIIEPNIDSDTFDQLDLNPQYGPYYET